MKILQSTIHHAMPLFKNKIKLKIHLNNFLILNNEHRILSFTFLQSFDYSTMALSEVSLKKKVNFLLSKRF